MMQKKICLFKSMNAFKKIGLIILFVLVYQLTVISCNKKPKPEQNPPVSVAKNQMFILSLSVDKSNVSKLKEMVQKDLFPLLVSNKDIKSLKVFNSPPDGSNVKFLLLIEMTRADEKGISLSNSGKLEKLDFSHFISTEFKNSPEFKNLTSSIKDMVKEYELKVYNLNEDLLINRDVMGYVKYK